MKLPITLFALLNFSYGKSQERGALQLVSGGVVRLRRRRLELDVV